MASRAESIDSAVTRIVGSGPTAITHVVVDDPYEISNGSAWPFINQPAINLWAAPPTPRDDIGEFRLWGEMLVSHEFTHIAHLTRPSRNALIKRLWQTLPADIGPVAIDSPRWVIEGYATFVEGRVTGSGRPHGAWRAAMLRQWALEGQLPRYDQLDDAPGFDGGEFAYLAGSAFLEWLVQRPGQNDASLVALWRRMTAKQTRGFDEAFVGVFGERPGALYGRFLADVTGRSIEVARAIGATSPISVVDTGTIIQRLALGTGDPAISPDGRHVALVVRSLVAPSRVIVWGTAAEPDTGKTRRDSILLAHDPDDVPSRAIYPSAKKVLASLQSPGGSPYESPRFLRDGRVLLARNTSTGDGSLRSDLYLWNPASNNVRRVTHGASLHEADPLPSGRGAVATQCRRGWCDVVYVSLAEGAMRPLLTGNPSRSYFRPRASPDGARFVVSMHDDRAWTLEVVDTAGRSTHVDPPSPGANCYDASWSGAANLVAVCDVSGIANLWSFDTSSGWRQLTRVTGAAVAPVENPADSSIWFLSLYSRGYDIRRIPKRLGITPNPVELAGLSPAISEQPTAGGSQFAKNAVSPPRPFGLTPRALRWLADPEIDADGATVRATVVSADLIGRSEILANGAVGDASGWRGGSLNITWRGFRPSFRAQVFGVEQRPSESRSGLKTPGLDARMDGGVASFDGSESFDTWSARYRLGGSVSRLRVEDASTVSGSLARNLAFADGAVAWTQRGAASTITESLGGTVAAGRSMGEGIVRTTTSAAISGAQRGLPPFALSASYGTTNAAAPRFEQFALGGTASPLVERDLLTQRMAMPALPTGVGIGSSVFTYRVSLPTDPISFYYWGGSTAGVRQRFAQWHRVIGATATLFSVPAIPLAGTPAARAQIGIGRSLDAPFRGKTRGYLGLVINP
ncbi:MAG: hypothetical protein ABI085_08085 [Gemmatimonadaceae bacterium]